MISTKDLIYDVEMKLNKVATLRHQGIPREEIIIVLNLSQIQLIKQRVNPNNIYKLGIDSFNKRFDDFKAIIPPDKELSIVKLRDNIYVSDLSKVSDYMFWIGSYITANKGECKDRVINISKLIPHADVNTWMENSHLCPSFEYQETFAVLSSNGIEVYTDGTFTPNHLYLRYVRYPQKMDISGYIHIDGTPSTDSDSELPEYLREDIVNLTVQKLAAMTENLNAYEASKQASANDE